MKSFITILLLSPLLLSAQLRVGSIFSDNMVLQHGKPICIFGKANPKQLVAVTFNGETKSNLVQSDSNWIVVFKKQSISKLPQSLKIESGLQEIRFENIIIGDVWLCIGQSNMEFPMTRELHFKDEKNNSNFPLIRFYNPTYAGKNTYNIAFSDSIVKKLNAKEFYEGQWQICDSLTFKNMSAVAYYFGKSIFTNTDIPIGLINLSIGGAPLETFISNQALKNSNQFSNKVSGNWLTNSSLPIWVRERGSQNIGSLSSVLKDDFGKFHSYKPGFAYDAGLTSLIQFPIKGIICYQGESNAQELDRVYEYAALTQLMISNFRNKWKEPKLPYYFVQLSSKDTLKYKSEFWPQFRDQQRLIMDLVSNTGMAVSSDLGFKNDVHPTNKKEVGIRLANWALNKNYKIKIIPSGPLPIKATYRNGNVVISFNYLSKGLLTSDGLALRGFSLDGINDSVATIEHETVLIKSKTRPEYVYYGWKPFTDANLINSEYLPTSTFKIPVL
ncbi:MAG: sialate O-acetylesterase [Chitinophagaceae bacterium BSSC1]|nr:MAG: sialate O-acetylesterase [Chitinophagaceae bacterium BSSC1]